MVSMKLTVTRSRHILINVKCIISTGAATETNWAGNNKDTALQKAKQTDVISGRNRENQVIGRIAHDCQHCLGGTADARSNFMGIN